MFLSERLLQFIWQFKLFDITNIRLVDDERKVSILSTGLRNKANGPDFTNASVKIDQLNWIGDVEIHLKSSDWHKHRHSEDKNYNKIILHVVYEHDTPIQDNSGNTIPTIALKTLIDENLLAHYHLLMSEEQALPCAKFLPKVKELVWQQWLERLTVERLLEKGYRLQSLLEGTQNDWNEVLYIATARSFGGAINAEAMQALATRVPLRYLAREKHHPTHIHIMLLGTAGLLPDLKETNDDSSQWKEMHQTYHLLQKKYRLIPLEANRWKISGMLPQAFPNIRIAQLAELVKKSSNLLQKILDKEMDAKTLHQLIQVDAGFIWNTRFTFNGKVHPFKEKKIGNTLVYNIIINTIAPFYYIYGTSKGDTFYKQRALSLLEALPQESNQITRHFLQAGRKPLNAGESQALIQLFKNYCSAKKCLDCSAGYTILKSAKGAVE